MLLRTRISLLGVLVVVIVALCIVFAGFQREELIRNQFSDEVINNQLNLWANIIDEQIEIMEDKLSLVQNNEQLVTAMENQDAEAIRLIGEQIVDNLKSENTADRLDVLYPDVTLAYSSHSAVFRSPIIEPNVAKGAMQRMLDLSGVGNDRQRNTAVIVATPLVSSTTENVVGLAIFAKDIVHALVEMGSVNASTVIIANRRGRLLEASNPSEWEQFSTLIDLREINTLQTISVDDRFYSVSVLPQAATLGSLVGRLVSVSDVTEHINEQQQVSQLTIWLICAFVLLSLISLHVYLSRSFRPLNEGVQVLNALARGDTHAHIEHTTHNDEVGQIARAVNVYRSNLINFNRFKRSRERQRARQERFIHREMTRLADSLDGEERRALLSELKHLGRVVKSEIESGKDSYDSRAAGSDSESSSIQDSDSLAMVAVAFQSMSRRVQDQYHRLREALATKETLIALRKELDIAKGVQLSLLPKRFSSNDSFDIFGGMWPAKEVGGDFLDYFRLDDNRVAVAIADVSGKGVPAALFTVMTRTLLRNTVSHVESPGKVLESVNQFLEQNNNENLFVTLFCAILDERTGKLVYANGGHNPPIVRDSKGTRTLKTTDGIVLGMFGDMEFENGYFDLEPDSTLVMFTDGIPEAFDINDEAFGDDRLLDTVARLPKQNAAGDVQFIFDQVNEFVADAPQFDDIACIVLHFHSPRESN